MTNKQVHLDAIITIDVNGIKRVQPRGMWGAIHCNSTDCKFYWENNCMLNVEGKIVHIEDGVCDDFIVGKHEMYKDNEEKLTFSTKV